DVWTSQFRLTEQTLYPYSTGRTCRVTNLLKKDFRITKSWEEPVLVDLGREIVRSSRTTCQLYAGHRGAGKSTELLRLKQDLENKGCLVVYFAAVGEDGDIDPEDSEYTDILLASTRHLLEGLQNADPAPLVNWLKARLKAMQDLGLTEIQVDSISAEAGIKEFAKLSTMIPAVPAECQKIRNLVNPHYYNKACRYGLQGNIERAIDSLQRAIALDPAYREMAKPDTDLDSIRESNVFRALVDERQ
nr:tetratricopeptide repeat protein [Drouetiella hepatica Uher 2000/2452]